LRKRGAFGFGQRLERRLRAAEEARAVLKARVLRGDFGPFAVARRQAFEFRDQVLDFGALRLALREVLLRLVDERLQALPRAVRLRRFRGEVLGAGVGVEQGALRRGTQQRLVLVLAVDVDQVFTGGLELAERRRVAVDEAARAAGAIDGPAQEHGAGVAGKVGFLQPSRKRLAGRIEFRRELGALGAFAHQRGVAAAADEELDGVDQNRLAGAGLARERGEASAELDAGALHDHKIPYVERAQHALV